MVKKWLTILGILLSSSLFGTGFETLHDFNQSMQKAQKEDKLVLLMVSQEGCPMCIYMKNNTLRDANVSDLIGHNFIFVEKESADEDLPEKYETFVTPTFFVIDPKSAKPIDSPIHGGFKPPAFVRILKLYLKEKETKQ